MTEIAMNDRRATTRGRGWQSPAVRHAAMLVLLIGGFFVSRLYAQGAGPAAADPAASLLARWLSPDAVIGGALVLLYVGELRGDVKRLKAENAAMNQRLHDDFLTKELAEARYSRRDK